MVTGFHLTGNLYRAEGWLFIAKLDWKSQENTLLELTPPGPDYLQLLPPSTQNSSALSLSLFGSFCTRGDGVCVWSGRKKDPEKGKGRNDVCSSSLTRAEAQ